jgi:hypothetical protein
VKTKAVLTTVCVALAVVCSGSAALADILPSFNASVLSGTSASGSSAVSTAFDNSIPIGGGTLSQDEFAAAGSGGVRASSKVSLFRSGSPGLDSASGPAQAGASATFFDFMITGPGTSVSGSVNFSLSGTTETTASISDTNPFVPGWPGNTLVLGGATIDVGVSGSVNGNGFTGAFSQQSGANGQGPTGFITAGSGIFSGDSAAPTGFTTATTLLPVGTLFQVSLGLGTDAFAFWGSSGSAAGELTTVDLTALSDFHDTLSFATTGPVFNLPGGYTVNSLSADIVNNAFTPPGASTSVPEPGTLILLGTGLLGMAGGFRRKWLG